MTTDNPTAAHRDAPTASSAVDAQHARVPARRSKETKGAFKTTEFIVYVVAVVGVLIASFLVNTTDPGEGYFRADRAWLYVVILSIGYMVSRGLAKSGSRHHDPQASRETHAVVKTTQTHKGRGRRAFHERCPAHVTGLRWEREPVDERPRRYGPPSVSSQQRKQCCA